MPIPTKTPPKWCARSWIAWTWSNFTSIFGCPVGYLLALEEPERVRGLIVQSGNAHMTGLDADWQTSFEYWSDPTEENRLRIPPWLDYEGTRRQYMENLPERIRCRIPPECWHLDWERMSREGNVEAQWRIFKEYKTHVARFQSIQDYHSLYQPPALVLWGRHDSFFLVDEVMSYNRELERCESHIFDGGHFILETHADACAGLIASFVADVEDERVSSRKHPHLTGGEIQENR